MKPTSKGPADAAPTMALIGACFYLRPARFAARADALVRAMSPHGRAASRQYVAMRDFAGALGSRNNGETWLTGAGPYLDISAYARALDGVQEADLYLFFNDTLFLKHPWTLAGRRLASLARSLASSGVPAAAGAVDASPPLVLHNRLSPNGLHLSTFCFLLNRAALAVFKEVLSELPADESPLGVRQWLDDKMRAHEALRHTLHVHLLGPETPWTWRPAGDAAEGLKLRKAVTVVFEHLFTERLLLQGGIIMPTNLDWRYRVQAKLAAMTFQLRGR